MCDHSTQQSSARLHKIYLESEEEGGGAVNLISEHILQNITKHKLVDTNLAPTEISVFSKIPIGVHAKVFCYQLPNSNEPD